MEDIDNDDKDDGLVVEAFFILDEDIDEEELVETEEEEEAGEEEDVGDDNKVDTACDGECDTA